MGAWRKRERAKSLLIAGGGTGGHVFPALAVAQEWLRRGIHREPKEEALCLLEPSAGWKTKLVPQAGFPLELIRAAGLKGIGGMKLLRNAAMLPAGLWDSEKIIHRHHFNVAFGVGGYASGPMILAGRAAPHSHGCLRAKRRAWIHEPHPRGDGDARCGGARGNGARLGRKAVTTGCPVRTEFFTIARKEQRDAPFQILITGGSRGALPINRAVIDSLDMLDGAKKSAFHRASDW